MPYSIIVFLWRKPGTTPSEFRTHYETKHIPLFTSLIGHLFPQTHSRVYLKRDPSSDATNVEYRPTVYVGTRDDFEYDLYCTMKFEDQATFEAFYQRMQEPEVAAKIAEDEERFLDRKKTIAAAVDEPTVTVQPSQ